MASNRLKKYDVRNPMKPKIRQNQRIANLDIMQVRAMRDAKATGTQ